MRDFPEILESRRLLESTTLDIRVAASVDDAEEGLSGVVNLKSPDLELVYDGGVQTVGMRFRGVAIPHGAIIDSAYIQFQVHETPSAATSLTIRGQAIDAAPPFSRTTGNISTRDRTSAAVPWSPAPWTTVGLAGPAQATPDIAAVMQEIVSRPGWSSGNPLAIIVNGTGERVAVAYDSVPSAAPLLHVVYHTPVAPPEPGAGILDVRVNASADDAEERRDGSVNVANIDLDMMIDGSTSQAAVAMRFSALAIPRGATIQNAYIQFYVDEIHTSSTTLNVQAQAIDSAPAFSSALRDITSRLRTAASVSWSPAAWSQIGVAESAARTSNVAAVIQEVIDRPGWLSGNALAFIVTGAGQRVAFAYDRSPTRAPVLHIEYQANRPPVASDQSVTTAINASRNITLAATDADGDTLTYRVTESPVNGTLSGIAPNLLYTPNAGFVGLDSFRFKANDGVADSNAAQVAITVSGSTIRVPQDQPTIQAGIDAARNGDLVLVAPGTYNGPFILANKTITLASQFLTTGDTSYITQTILNGNGVGAVITVRYTGPDTTISGLTIQNGQDGIGAYSKLQILNNYITRNGDGIDYQSAGGVARNNLFDSNTDDAIDLDGASAAILENNTLRNSGDDGIEIRLHPYTGPTLDIIIRNNVITGSREDGIQLIDYPGLSNRVFLIERNLIQNTAKAALGLMDNGETSEDYRAASIPERIKLFNNTLVDNFYGVTGGDNLIALNNLFVNTTNVALQQVDGGSIAAHNLFWGNGTNILGSNVDMATTRFSDPLLDSSFQLKPGSTAIDAGIAYFSWNGEVVLNLPPAAYTDAAPDVGWRETNYSQTASVAVAASSASTGGSAATSDVGNGSAGSKAMNWAAAEPPKGTVASGSREFSSRDLSRGIISTGFPPWVNLWFGQATLPALLRSSELIDLALRLELG